MGWAATSRYELEAAPGNLALVQDFVNTLSAGRPRGADLLADLPSAQAWLGGALDEWSRTRGIPADAVVLGDADLGTLRRFRSELVDLIRPGGIDANGDRDDRLAISGTSTLRLDETGRVRALPGGKGWRYVTSLLLIEMYEAQVRDTWRRLKTCSNRRCSAAFFDRSRNNSRVWHDVAVCGNLANLHAHRARRRAQGGSGR